MPANVMLDLETLGTAPGCVILSIGAVAFDAERITSEFSVHIDLRSSQRAGLAIEAGTFTWWLAQEDVARQALLKAEVVPLPGALVQFSDWVWSLKAPARLWAKGPSFDAAILSAAYRAVEFTPPWHFRDERCVRTALALTGIEAAMFGATNRVHHDALSDATAQAIAVQVALRSTPYEW